MSRRRDRRQAIAESLLKYGPQNDALTQILSGLRSDYKGDIRQARAVGRVLSRSAKRAVPELEKAYRPALKASGAADEFIESEIAARPENDPFRVAAAVDIGGTRKALSHSLANAQKAMVARGTSARVGTTQRVAALQGQYRSDVAKVIDQLTSNRAQQGLYASTRFGDLRGEAKSRALTRRGQDITRRGQTLAHKDRVADDKRADAEGTEPKPWATPTQHGAAQDAITAALADAKKLKDAAGLSREQAKTVLLSGDSASGIAKAKALYASIALDLAYGSGISARNQKELKKRRLRPKRLGFPLGKSQRASFDDSVNASPGGDRVQG